MTTTSPPLFSILRAWFRPLVELPLFGLLLLLGLGIFGLAQRPVVYHLAIGKEDGPGSDLPFIDGWNTAERSETMPYRWSADESHIRVAGLPRVPLVVSLQMLRADAHPAVDAAASSLTAVETRLATLPLADRRTLHLLVPPSLTPSGQLDLEVRAPTWTPANDPRVLGVPASGLTIETVTTETPGLVGVPLMLGWPLLALPLIWAPLRRWLPTRRRALLVAAIIGGMLLLALAADRARFALAGRPAVTALGWALAMGLVLRAALGAYAHRLGVRPSARLLDLLALIFVGLFALRYMGRLYPFSMPGDIGFHVNRENDVIRGNLLLVSRHRGIDFPYPPALYLLLLPFRLLPITAESLVNYADAFFGALGLFPLAYLALRGFRSERVALMAVAVYVLLAPAIMALWWSFLPHIFAQELAVMLFAGLVGGGAGLGARKGIALATLGFAVLFASHFGFYLNVSILVTVLLFILLVRGRRLRGWTPRATWGLAISFAVAQVLVLGLFYSAYLPLILDKLAAFGEGGMGAVQGGREARPWPVLARTLWRDGLGAHYAVVGVPLALLGGYRLWGARRRGLLPVLFGATLAVVVIQGAVPFVTSSDITTRWLSFAAWIVALGTGLVLDGLWSRGLAGRLLVFVTLGWIGWTTLWMWLQALAFRGRPPEPF